MSGGVCGCMCARVRVRVLHQLDGKQRRENHNIEKHSLIRLFDQHNIIATENKNKQVAIRWVNSLNSIRALYLFRSSCLSHKTSETRIHSFNSEQMHCVVREPRCVTMQSYFGIKNAIQNMLIAHSHVYLSVCLTVLLYTLYFDAVFHRYSLSK